MAKQQFIRADFNVNGVDHHIADAPASAKGFERIMREEWIIYQDTVDELTLHGEAGVDFDAQPDYVELVLDILNVDELPQDCRVGFTVCLWELDTETDEEEHILTGWTPAR